MNISLSPQQQAFVQSQVKTGNYQSADDVVNEALRLMAARAQRLATLQPGRVGKTSVCFAHHWGCNMVGKMPFEFLQILWFIARHFTHPTVR